MQDREPLNEIDAEDFKISAAGEIDLARILEPRVFEISLTADK